MKLYEIILRKLGWWKDPPPVVQETQVFNPKNVRIGSVVNLNVLDFRGIDFFVTGIRELQVENDKFVDYLLKSDKKECRLRLVPNNDSALILSLFDEKEYENDFYDVVSDQSGIFIIDEEEEYKRVGGVIAPLYASVTFMEDVNGDGKVAEDEVTKAVVQFWDFSRMATVDGVQEEQFLFVELDQESKWFQLFHGTTINLFNVKTY